MLDLVRDLLRPDAYPTPPERVELIETHISWVFLAGSDVYKVKKPVALGFLDFRSLTQRREACLAEATLNRRLAGGIYVGVVSVRRDADGVYRIDGPGVVVDWAVHMVRLPEDRRADNLLQRGELGGQEIDAMATRLAAFHAEARCDAQTVRFGEVEVIRRNVEENFAQTRDRVDRYLSRAEFDEIETRQTSYLRDKGHLFEERVKQARVRDGHGDLRLEHVYLMGGHIDVIDCIEFNERFRFADVCADIAFLSMDLAEHGRVDLAERLLARYARESNDFDLYALVDFYEGYRAYVRAKISMLLSEDPGVDPPLRDRAERDARRYLLLALSTGRSTLLAPWLVCVGGIIASGKSTVAEHIAGELSAPVVEADRTRKHLIGVSSSTHLEERPWQGAYDPEVTERVYAELLRRAGVVIASGRPVIVDASFRTRTTRRQAREVAIACGVPFLFVECRVGAEMAKERLRRREAASGISDARLPLFEDFSARFEAADELSNSERLVPDTGRPLEETLAVMSQHLHTWPCGLVV